MLPKYLIILKISVLDMYDWLIVETIAVASYIICIA